MRHFFTLHLELQICLFLRADVERDADRFQGVAVFVLQASSTHDYPADSAVGQEQAMLTLESPVKRARLVVFRFNRGALVRMHAGKNQLARERQVLIESIDEAAF